MLGHSMRVKVGGHLGESVLFPLCEFQGQTQVVIRVGGKHLYPLRDIFANPALSILMLLKYFLRIRISEICISYKKNKLPTY